MRVKLMTFRYSATLGGFDDTPLVEFIRDKEVLSFREHPLGQERMRESSGTRTCG